jgi:hypothetical protein
MSLSVAPPFAFSPHALTVRTAEHAPSRDLRIDFFRGLALLMIFIDHVSGNKFALLTLQRMGFADAAEVFVFIAGLTAILAYRKTFERGGFLSACQEVFRRVKTLYLAHLATLAGVLLFAAVAVSAGTGFDIIRKLGLAPLIADPLQALLLAPVLGYMPNYLDILPLYVILLAFIPLILASLRLHVLAPLTLALAVYAAASTWNLNLPNLGDEAGWFLNPFAWAFLFVTGATVAQLTINGFWNQVPGALKTAITLLAFTYVIFAFLHAAPWRIFPVLEPFAALPFVMEINKAFLSWHRLIDVLAKAWLVAVLIPRNAAFMSRGAGAAVNLIGRHSLPVFTAGVFLSLFGSVMLFEAQEAPYAQIGVTLSGIALLFSLAWLLEHQKEGIKLKPAGRTPAASRSGEDKSLLRALEPLGYH